MPKYEVTLRAYAYIAVEAENEEEALQKALRIGHQAEEGTAFNVEDDDNDDYDIAVEQLEDDWDGPLQEG